MSIASRLKDVEETLGLLRDASRLQGRHMSATAPTDKQVVMWNATTSKWEPVTGAQILFARCTSTLTLTTSFQSITGDGNSSKVRLLLPTIGDWLVEVAVDFAQNGASSPGLLEGALFVDDSGSAESGEALYQPTANPDRATVLQRWKVTTTAANTPVELKAKMETGGGNAIAASTHTTLTASIGIGGGSVGAASDHGNLTGLGDTSDHEYVILKDGTRDFTGSQSMGSNKITSLTAGSASGEAVEYDQLHDEAHKDEHEVGGSDAFDATSLLHVGAILIQASFKGNMNALSAETRDTAAGILFLRAWTAGGASQEEVARAQSSSGASGTARFEIKQGKLTGELEANSNKITGLAAPTDDNDAARKADVIQEVYIPFGNEPEAGVTIFPT